MEHLDLWILFYETKDLELRNQLVEKYLGVVSYVIKNAINAYDLPPGVDREDLQSFGIVGLIQAVERFNPYQGVKFETYAIARVRGEILDNLRRLKLAPRPIIHSIHTRRTIEGQLAQRLLREPTKEEVEKVMGDDQSDFAWEEGGEICSLSSILIPEEGTHREGMTFLDILAQEEPDPILDMEKEELILFVMRLIRKLREREKLVIMLYYFERLPFRVIGEILGVTESRAWQIHNEVIQRLKIEAKREKIEYMGP